MRDFKARDINGDVHINDQSTKYKLLIQCNIEELLQEERQRRDNLRRERKRKNSLLVKLFCACIAVLSLAALWYFAEGQMNAVTLLLGFASIMIGFTTIIKAEQPTEFERRQLDTLHEIHMILRDRGVR
ncbi:hypothetical protein CAG64_15820 [Vibrio sp. V38_P2S17PM301]|uniref:hypothetical protein n=1 Tax=unclassified Vibrio TaxID=2614977 RepID=UPI0013616C08|nr:MULTISPECIES: hypothetical protein [unclassified Vibrio]NAX26911.1 hypothetical protein [Vibrio sp. V38_P2S17PM301]NAX31339.1 hypothetical protein [Vibrio sp. V37_P2S8PM304]